MTNEKDITPDLTVNEQLSAILDEVRRNAARLDIIDALVKDRLADNRPVWQVIDAQLGKMSDRQEEIFQILSKMRMEISGQAARQLALENTLNSLRDRAEQAER